jgi:hypothetical protein
VELAVNIQTLRNIHNSVGNRSGAFYIVAGIISCRNKVCSYGVNAVAQNMVQYCATVNMIMNVLVCHLLSKYELFKEIPNRRIM